MKILGNDWAVKERKDCSVDWVNENCARIICSEISMSFQKYFFGIKTYTEKRVQQFPRLLS